MENGNVTQTGEEFEAEPRQCSKCGKFQGNGTGKIERGRIGRDPSGRYVPEWFCQSCCDKEGRYGRHLLKARFLLARIRRLNAERQKRIRAIEAENTNFAAAKDYWIEVATGKAEHLPEVRKDEKGMLLCGVSGCYKCGNSERAEHFAVIKTAEGKFAVVGLCLAQAAALAKSGVTEEEIPRNKFFRKMVRKAEWRNRRIEAFEAAKAYWDKLAADRASLPEVRKDDKGNFLCGVPSCPCRTSGSVNRPVEHLVVFEGDGEERFEVAGICKMQAAALSHTKTKAFFVAKGPEALVKCLSYIKRQTVAIHRRRTGNHHTYSRPPYIFGPEVWVDPRHGRGEKTKASRVARARQEAYLKSLRGGNPLSSESAEEK